MKGDQVLKLQPLKKKKTCSKIASFTAALTSWGGGKRKNISKYIHGTNCFASKKEIPSVHFWSAIRMTHIKACPCVSPASKLFFFFFFNEFLSYKREVPGGFLRKDESCK